MNRYGIITAEVAAPPLLTVRASCAALEACRACPRYGRRWGCPPFSGADASVHPCRRFSRLALVALVVPAWCDLCCLRRAVEPALIGLEKAWKGRAAALPGDCPWCDSEAVCTRPEGNACRHPELVRPSLEALGIDVMGLIGGPLGLEASWGGDELTLVAGVYHSGDEAALEHRLDQLASAVEESVGRLTSASRRRES